MTQVFISSCDIEAPHASSLVECLREAGFRVTHSPGSPSSERWRDWYARNCRDELEKASIFIAVIDPAWDSSTWMAHEANEAMKLLEAGRIRKMYYWNPEQVQVKAAGMAPYLKDRLPDNKDVLISTLREIE
ncbi:MAG TPA: toll/interleukin-1 receptor domain-containing protein [Pyrinomonadaceae bacterium]|nr:toll/interleukin-1 receptor domain-containing protein [Pyrinomonadaceae bacterium]